MSPKQITHVERMKRRILQLEGSARKMDAELQRHKRAIQWCVTNGAHRMVIGLPQGRGEHVSMLGWNGQNLEIPSDIADLIKGQS